MKIRATVEVAILFIANDSCQFVKFVGKKNNSRHFRCARKRQFQVVPVVVIKQPLIALVPIRAIRGQKISLRTICLEGSTERSDGNRGRSPREEAIALILPGRQYATGHVNNPLIALVPISATDPVAIQSIEMIRVNPCNSWAKKQQVGKNNLQPIQPTDLLFCLSNPLQRLLKTHQLIIKISNTHLRVIIIRGKHLVDRLQDK